MKRRILILAVFGLFLLFLFAAAPEKGKAEEGDFPVANSTADHHKFQVLKKKFKTAPEVTEACLTCHTEASAQVMKTIHWTWTCPKSIEEGRKPLGKGHAINNFCISVLSNEARCTSCHAGYGWKDKNFDFKNPRNVDCLVCHDTTGTYRKFPTDAGHPPYQDKVFKGKVFKAVDLNYVARNVGPSSRKNCGACHFFGGGGDNVKHGDLSSCLYNPSRELDVHMAADGPNFSCTKCHETKAHEIPGRCYEVPPEAPDTLVLPEDKGPTLTCESCHGNSPHEEFILNTHTRRVSCQTCHIPEIARCKPTELYRDWSQAGKLDENGRPFVKTIRKTRNGVEIYNTNEGLVVEAENVIPSYRWYNGAMKYVRAGDKLKAEGVIIINKPLGGPEDPKSKIYPFKVHRGKQPFDPVNNIFITPKLFGPKGSGAFWAEHNWEKSAKAGMEYAGFPFSGKITFVETETYWPINHEVAPREKALSCGECHSRHSRLAGITGIYLPGRDYNNLLDTLGWLLVVLTLVGIFIHGLGRIFIPKRK